MARSWATSSCVSAPLCALLGLAALGCGGGPDYDVAPVRGTVKIDGEPLGGGRVMFAPVATGDSVKSGKPGFGDIQSDGSYVVSTYGDGDGAVVAKHWVTLISTGPNAQWGERMGVERAMVPSQVTVEADEENVVPIELTSDQVRKYGERGD